MLNSTERAPTLSTSPRSYYETGTLDSKIVVVGVAAAAAAATVAGADRGSFVPSDVLFGRLMKESVRGKALTI